MSKSLSNNTFFNVLYRFINIAFPLVVSIYVSRVLLVESIGEVSYAQNIASYFVSLAILGLPNYGTKIIAKIKENKEELNKSFSELFICNFITTAVSTLFYISLIAIAFRAENINLYIASGLLIVFNFLNIDWLYQGVEDYQYIALRNIVIKILALSLLFVFVRSSNDFIIYAYISSASTGCNYILNVLHSRKYVSFTFKGINIKRHLLVSLVLGVGVICSTLYSKVDITMIGSMLGKESVAYYTYAHNIITIFVNICTAMTAVFLPRLSFYYSNDKEKFFELVQLGIHSVCLLAFPIIAGCILLAPEAILILYGEGFEPAILAVRMFAIIVFIKSIGDLCCYQVAIASSREKQVTFGFIIGTVVNIVLNIPLIFYFGIYGAVVASVVGEIVIDLFTFVGLRKEDRFLVPIRLTWKPFVAALIMAGLVIIPLITIKNIILRTIVCVLVGVITYFISINLFQDKMVIDVEKKILMKARSIFRKKS